MNIYAQFDKGERDILVMVRTDPGRRSNHSNNRDYDANDSPSEHNLGRMLLDVVLEGADDGEDEPRDA